MKGHVRLPHFFPVLCMVLASVPARAQEAENLLKNPGFEQTVPYEPSDELRARGVEAFELPAHCAINGAYPGKVTVVYDPETSHGGMKYVRLERARGEVGLMHGWQRKTQPGERYRFSVWARGSGTLSLYAYLYDRWKGPMRGKPCMARSWQISDEEAWRRCEWELTIPQPLGTDSRSVVGYFVVAYHVKGAADLDDAGMYRAEGRAPPSGPTGGAEAGRALERRPLLTVTKTDVPPVIDGQIGDEEWKCAGAVTGFVDLGGNLTGDDTVFYTTYDERNLYIAFSSTVEGRPAAEVAERDGPVHDDDAVEIFLQPDPERPDSYYQFIGNSSGTFLDGWRTNKSWNADWRFANRVVDSGETVGGVLTFAKSIWTGEVAVAFKALGAAAPKDGDLWRANFCRDWTVRQRGVMARWTSWSAAGSSFHRPENFGYLYFAEERPAVQLLSFGDLVGGDVRIEARAFNPAAEPVSLDGKLLLSLPDSGKVILRKRVHATVNAAQRRALSVREAVKLVRPLPLRLTFAVSDTADRNLLHRSVLTFTARPSFRLDTALLYGRGQVQIALDVRRLPRLPPSFCCTVEIRGAEDGRLRAEASVDELNADNPLATRTVDISALPAGDYVVKAHLKDGEKVIAQQNADFSVPQRPEWWGNRLGISEQVPPPWRPVSVKGNAVSVLGREYRFRLPFPAQVTANGRPLLSSPMRLDVLTETGPVKWRGGLVRCVGLTDRKAEMLVTVEGGRLDLTGEIEIEFDGFVRVDFSLVPREPVELRRLFLSIPCREENALYVKGLKVFPAPDSGWYAAALYEGAQGGVFDIRGRWFFSAEGWLWPDEFMHYVWVGGDQAGLSVTFDSDKNFRTGRYVEVVEAEGTKELRFNFIDEPCALEEPLSYTLALHATPVKPLPRDPRRWHYGYQCGDEIAIYRGLEAACSYGLTPGPAWPQLTPQGKKKIEELREIGIRAFPDYYTNITTVELPEFQTFGSEWETVPSTRWPWREPYTGVVVCARGSYADFLIWGLDRLIDQGVGGIYFDSGGVLACTNRLHGCGYVDRDGNVRPTIGLFEARETYKRIYTLFKSRDPNSFIFSHAVPISPLASFVDGATESEEWTPGNATLDDLKPDFVRFGFAMYHQYGIPYSFYPSLAVYGAPEQQVPFQDLLPVTLVHNVYPIAWCGTIRDLKPVWEIMDEWYTDSEWIPYWRNRHLVSSFHEDVRMSLYLKDKRALLLIANIGKEPRSGKVVLDLAGLGLSADRAVITRLDREGAAPSSGPELGVSLPARSVQFYRVTER